MHSGSLCSLPNCCWLMQQLPTDASQATVPRLCPTGTPQKESHRPGEVSRHPATPPPQSATASCGAARGEASGETQPREVETEIQCMFTTTNRPETRHATEAPGQQDQFTSAALLSPTTTPRVRTHHTCAQKRVRTNVHKTGTLPNMHIMPAHQPHQASPHRESTTCTKPHRGSSRRHYSMHAKLHQAADNVQEPICAKVLL